MDNNLLYTNFLRQGTAGYAIVSKFYFRYADLLTKASLMSIDDIVHEIFISISKTNFEKVHNAEHYIMRAIKLQCWTLLDKALRLKEIMVESGGAGKNDEEKKEKRHIDLAEKRTEHLVELEGMELMVNINLFKGLLSAKEKELLNFLIDERERADIAEALQMNLNTLDTNIRRLRIKLAGFLKGLGYTYKELKKFS